MPETSYTTDPSGTIKKKFSTSVQTTGGDPGLSPVIPPINTADLASQPIPQTGPSPEEIAAFYQPILDQIQNEAVPLSRPVPADISPTGTFLGLLAGNLATTFTQNPAFAQQAQQYLAEQNRQKQAITEQNYADELAFSAEKRNKLISIRGKILETQLEKAISDGNQEQALAISTELGKMQEGLKRESQRQEAQQRQALIQEEGRQQRLTNAQKATLTAEEEKSAASKPLTTKQYLDARNAVARNKELDEKTTSRWKAFGMSLPFGPRDATPTEREEQMEQIDVATIKNGEPTAVKAAKANLKRSVLKRLGLLGTPVNPEGRALLQNELQQYGLTMADMQ
jgi:hypothetical protein